MTDLEVIGATIAEQMRKQKWTEARVQSWLRELNGPTIYQKLKEEHR